MPDNAKAVAQKFAASLPFAGDAALYAKVVELLELAIREEREAVLAANIKLRDEWGDDNYAEVFSADLAKKLMRSWGMV